MFTVNIRLKHIFCLHIEFSLWPSRFHSVRSSRDSSIISIEKVLHLMRDQFDDYEYLWVIIPILPLGRFTFSWLKRKKERKNEESVFFTASVTLIYTYTHHSINIFFFNHMFVLIWSCLNVKYFLTKGLCHSQQRLNHNKKFIKFKSFFRNDDIRVQLNQSWTKQKKKAHCSLDLFYYREKKSQENYRLSSRKLKCKHKMRHFEDVWLIDEKRTKLYLFRGSHSIITSHLNDDGVAAARMSMEKKSSICIMGINQLSFDCIFSSSFR